ncbi:hypothetical protein [Paenibacillus sp. YN15]|uniref:hypothetical protein n=1 Tax=Paenibacillus sp. YN15 TaxID=1742774 RepID=UPI000DCEF062|nr:hypothetical protein [Paenibacillus sp. YN15]RAV03019.1 hypothetical protein DQG13_08065 [Paenibacillus sp. YN15]
MPKTILLEIDIEEGEDYVVKELLAYLAYTKRIKKYLWQEKESASQQNAAPSASPAPSVQRSAPKDASAASKSAAAAPKPAPAPAPPAPKNAESSQMMMSMLEDLSRWKKENKLIRLKALKGKGKFLDIACKIVSHDADVGTVTVYDVDRKVVETVRLTEIEDIALAL